MDKPIASVMHSNEISISKDCKLLTNIYHRMNKPVMEYFIHDYTVYFSNTSWNNFLTSYYIFFILKQTVGFWFKIELYKKLRKIAQYVLSKTLDSNGDYFNVGIMVGKESFYAIVKVPHEKFDLPDPLKEVEVFAKVPAANNLKPSYFHRYKRNKFF